MSASGPLSLFEGYGVEIETVLVDRATLDVRPVADEVLSAAAGGPVCDHDDGPIGWSNELVLHLLETKTNGPVATLAGVADDFQASLGRLGGLLEPLGARLMPGGMHPWMDPARETKLWSLEVGEIYATYDRIFDCRRHGWANVQAMHLNLPFADEEEFGRLLAAVRFLLPLVPALAASSPIREGRPAGLLDARLEAYRTNALRVPAMTGEVIPEPVYGVEEYRERVLAPIVRELAPLDPERALAGNEWTNARGAIARFDRDAIEIRLADVQECPRADLAVAAALAGVARALVEERWISSGRQKEWPSAPLVELLAAAVADGPGALLAEAGYAEALGAPEARTLGELWRALAASTADLRPSDEALEGALATILERGTLAERILAATGPSPSRERLAEVYGELCDCLDASRTFDPDGARHAPR